jgi:hypothetical protein
VSGKSQFPRDYQIAEMMRGREFQAPLKRRHILIIAEFITTAWRGLLENYESVVREKEEKEVNDLLVKRLNHLKDESQILADLVVGVSRGRETDSCDASSLEKRPDISIHLTQRNFEFPLIVECKLIHANDSKRVRQYCGDGLIRYIEGDYSWYAHEAFMLAYVRDGSIIADCLTPYLITNQSKSPDPFLTEQLPESVKFPFCELSNSRHGRRCRENEIPAITVWHLWIS